MTLRPQIYAFKSILVQFLVNHTTFCVLLPIFYSDFDFEFTQVSDFEDIFFKLINKPFLIPLYVSIYLSNSKHY